MNFTCAHIQIFFCGNKIKDEDNSPKTLNNKNQQASSQKFRQLTQGIVLEYIWVNMFIYFSRMNYFIETEIQ